MCWCHPRRRRTACGSCWEWAPGESPTSGWPARRECSQRAHPRPLAPDWRFLLGHDAGVLLLHAGERQWAKLCFELSPQGRPTAVTVVTRDTSDDCNSFEVASSTLWLRVARTGKAWAFHAAQDGAWWRLVRYFALGADAADVRVGFLAQSPTGQGCTAIFEHIALLAGAPVERVGLLDVDAVAAYLRRLPQPVEVGASSAFQSTRR